EGIAGETLRLVHTQPAAEAVQAPDLAALGTPLVVQAIEDGWVQQLSFAAMLGATPPRSVVRGETRVGAYLPAREPLATTRLAARGAHHDASLGRPGHRAGPQRGDPGPCPDHAAGHRLRPAPAQRHRAASALPGGQRPDHGHRGRAAARVDPAPVGPDRPASP